MPLINKTIQIYFYEHSFLAKFQSIINSPFTIDFNKHTSFGKNHESLSFENVFLPSKISAATSIDEWIHAGNIYFK